MNTTQYIISKIDGFPNGYIFTCSDFGLAVDKPEAVIKCLNRLVGSGKINKLAKGKYYKPEISAFGSLQPSQYQIVKDLLEKNGKIVGYITGYGAYNELGLTTQVSNTIQIGRTEVKPALKRGIYKIAFIKQKNKISKNNIPLLKILDAIRFIKTIPDTTIDNSCIRLIAIIKKLTDTECERIIKLSLQYPPAVRALLGALIEKSMKGKKRKRCRVASGGIPTVRFSLNQKPCNFKELNNLGIIRKSLNPITTYKLPVSRAILTKAKDWNIR